MNERFDDKKHVPDMASNTSGYLQVRGGLDGPACHVCGAIMYLRGQWGGKQLTGKEVGRVWDCQSCGTTTGCS